MGSATTGAAPEFVGSAYEPMGKIEAGGEQAYEYVAPKEPTDWGTVEEIRALVGKSGDYFASQQAYCKYQEFCEVTKIENIGGKEFHDLAESTYAYIHDQRGTTETAVGAWFITTGACRLQADPSRARIS